MVRVGDVPVPRTSGSDVPMVRQLEYTTQCTVRSKTGNIMLKDRRNVRDLSRSQSDYKNNHKLYMSEEIPSYRLCGTTSKRDKCNEKEVCVRTGVVPTNLLVFEVPDTRNWVSRVGVEKD